MEKEKDLLKKILENGQVSVNYDKSINVSISINISGLVCDKNIKDLLNVIEEIRNESSQKVLEMAKKGEVKNED